MVIIAKRSLNGNSNDLSGNGYNGTDTSVTYVAGQANQGASFNSTTSNVLIGTNKFPAVKNNCTLFCLAFNDSSSAIQGIFSNGNNGTGGSLGWYFGIKLDGANNTYNYTKPGIINENTGITPVTGSRQSITFIISSYVGILYINGVLVRTGSNATVPSNNTRQTRIGSHTINTVASQFYDGSLDEVMFDDTIRSVAKIKNYHAYYKGFYS